MSSVFRPFVCIRHVNIVSHALLCPLTTVLCRRVYIPLPDLDARRTILQHYLADRLETGGDDASRALEDCAINTEGYSGADLRLLCKEAAMHPLRSLVEKLEAGAKVRGRMCQPSASWRVERLRCSCAFALEV